MSKSSILQDPTTILTKYFGFTDFRFPQSEIIDRVLHDIHGHCLVIMPTGAGKSLCYQIPALCLKGKTIVLSPLIALMQDQVIALKKRNIAAAFINSTVSKADREKRLQAFLDDKMKILYVTPERFRKKQFIEAVSKTDISLLAIDEAHCISSWGHDFRPDYSRISEIQKHLMFPRIIALTATATEDVQKDIIQKLDLKDESIKIFHTGINRPNLKLEAKEVLEEREKITEIENIIQNHQGSGIIYFALIKTLERFSEILINKNQPHLVYHGRLSSTERKRIQKQFMDQPDQLILATNAFGMGIDKPDIRFIIHAELTGSLESYYQEIGRAGRDGKPSVCSLLYDQNDILIQMDFIKWANPEPGFYKQLWKILQSDLDAVNAQGNAFLKEQLVYKNRFDFRLETALAMLERYDVIEGSADTGSLQLLSEDIPATLVDSSSYESKIKRDQKKLLAVVEYFRADKCRNISIQEYFGFHDEKECRICDRCKLKL